MIEVDGSVHDQPGYDDYDGQRQGFLEEQGLRALRFSNDDIMSKLPAVLTKIRDAVPGKYTPPPATPHRNGEESISTEIETPSVSTQVSPHCDGGRFRGGLD